MKTCKGLEKMKFNYENKSLLLTTNIVADIRLRQESD